MKVLKDLIKASEDFRNYVIDSPGESIGHSTILELLSDKRFDLLHHSLNQAIEESQKQAADPEICKLYCLNEKCSAKGSFINRTRKVAEQSIFFCDICNVPMVF